MRNLSKTYALGVGSFVQLGLLGINLLVTSRMTVPNRGAYAVIAAVLLTVSGLCNFGFSNALIKRLHQGDISRQYFRVMLGNIVVQILVAVLASTLLFWSFPYIGTEIVYANALIMAAVITSLILRSYLQSFLIGVNRIAYFQISKLIPVCVFFSVLYLRNEYRLTDILIAWLISEITIVVLLTLCFASIVRWSAFSDRSNFTQDLVFGFRSMFAGSSFIEGYKFDQIIIGYLLPLSAVAIYAVAKSVSLVLRFVPQSLSQIAYPAALQSSPERRLGVIRPFVLTSLASGIILIFIGQFLFVRYGVPYIGEEYAASSEILLLLFLGPLVYAPRRILYEYYKAANRPGTPSVIEFLVLGLYVIIVTALVLLDKVNLLTLSASILAVNAMVLIFVLRNVFAGNRRSASRVSSRG